MRVFVDTNILLSAYLSEGFIRQLRTRIFKNHDCIVTEEVLAECRRKLRGKFSATVEAAAEHEVYVRHFCLVLPVQAAPQKVSRDPDDDWVLSAAVAAQCHCILSGDTDLTVLRTHKGIPILSPRDFLEFEDTRFKRRKR